MQFYTNFTAATSGILATLRKFWAYTGKLLPKNAKSNAQPAEGFTFFVKESISGPVFGIHPEIGDFDPKYLENGGTNSESQRFLPPALPDKDETKADEKPTVVSQKASKKVSAERIPPENRK